MDFALHNLHERFASIGVDLLKELSMTTLESGFSISLVHVEKLHQLQWSSHVQAKILSLFHFGYALQKVLSTYSLSK